MDFVSRRTFAALVFDEIMKIKIDEAKCIGCGLCVSNCPNAFELNYEGIAKVKKVQYDCDLKAVAGQCPVEAMEIVDAPN